jgi:hypothetical protein
MSKAKKQIDWLGIGRDCVKTDLSIREIARWYGCSDKAIRLRAKARGWARPGAEPPQASPQGPQPLKAGMITVGDARRGRQPGATTRGDAGAPVAGDRTRVLIYKIDTMGRRQTLGVVPFEVFDGSESRAIDATPDVALVSQNTSFTLIVAASQGAPGPSNIPAAQVSHSGAAGQGLMKAATPAAARQILSVAAFTRAAVQDVNYAVKATDTYVGVTALTAPRTITLPLAADYPAGQPLYIADESGACGTDSPIVVAAAGQDTIGMQPNVNMASPFLKFAFHSNGTNLWTV